MPDDAGHGRAIGGCSQESLSDFLFIAGAAKNQGSITIFSKTFRLRKSKDVMCKNLHVPALGPMAAYAKQGIRDKLIEHKQYIAAHGEDLPEIRNWRWGEKP